MVVVVSGAGVVVQADAAEPSIPQPACAFGVDLLLLDLRPGRSGMTLFSVVVIGAFGARGGVVVAAGCCELMISSARAAVKDAGAVVLIGEVVVAGVAAAGVGATSDASGP